MPEATRKYTIVLGEFENKSGNPAFDGVLRQGLSVQIDQSRALTLVPDQQLRQILRLMHRESDTRLAPDVAQEICERTGGIAILEGSVASLGGQYIMWLRARNCGTGDILAQEQAQAGSEEELLSASRGSGRESGSAWKNRSLVFGNNQRLCSRSALRR